MTYEEMQKTMQFIVEQQAQFTANIQRMQESQAQMQESQAKADERVTQLETLVTRLATATVTGFKDINAKIDALVDAQIRTEESIKKVDDNLGAKIDVLVDAQLRIEERLNAKINTLVDAQMRTDGAVRNLTAVVDRHFREGRNGG